MNPYRENARRGASAPATSFTVILATTLGALITFAPGCPPSPAPPVVIDASDGATCATCNLPDAEPPGKPDALAPAPPDASSQCELACQALTSAGCYEGTSAHCVSAMTMLDATKLMRRPDGQPVTCAGVATVKTPQDALTQGVGCTVRPDASR